MIKAMKQFFILTILTAGFNAVVLTSIHAQQNNNTKTPMVKFAQR